MDANDDGVQETDTGGDDEFVAGDTVEGEEISESAEDIFDLDGLTLPSCARWKIDGRRFRMMMGIYNLTSGTVTCTITARPEENYGYYFGGLPSGIYTARFSTDAFALGDYKDSTQNAEVSDEKAAFDAAGGFVNSVGGTEGTTNRGGRILAFVHYRGE